ncbi:hypothetical protein NADFUDRAFT_49964 [Nadsonia fulvescens var. elongata DSM 6958]|uniref:Uncharacterized protein n=1 Tax=Nadsonia fulvescens var. elongata DSM 6958 TaxID=857566 RepID=A0A1E3PQ25_9ASCO|nr:hypothetical protein NADFUDRAFT_49964 [Nadsonia fulvescens var. elongata DSM 6958]
MSPIQISTTPVESSDQPKDPMDDPASLDMVCALLNQKRSRLPAKAVHSSPVLETTSQTKLRAKPKKARTKRLRILTPLAKWDAKLSRPSLAFSYPKLTQFTDPLTPRRMSRDFQAGPSISDDSDFTQGHYSRHRHDLLGSYQGDGHLGTTLPQENQAMVAPVTSTASTETSKVQLPPISDLFRVADFQYDYRVQYLPRLVSSRASLGGPMVV